VHLVRKETMEREFERLPYEPLYEDVLGLPVRKVVIAVDAGRNLAVLVEAAVRNTVLQLRGIDTYQEFIERHQRAMDRATARQLSRAGRRPPGRLLRCGQSVLVQRAYKRQRVLLQLEAALLRRWRAGAARSRRRRTPRRGRSQAHLVKLGIDIGTEAIPKYEDVQFKLNFPMKNGDNLSVFGIGGYSQINFITSTRIKPEKRDIYASKDQDEYFRAGLGVLGITYTHRVNDHEYSKISVAVSTQFNRNHFERVIRHVDSTTGNFVLDSMYRKNDYFFVNTRYTASFLRNNKISARSSVRYGLVTEMLQPVFIDSNLLEPIFEKSVTNYTWKKRLDNRDGFHLLFQPFAQWKYALSEKLTTVVGIHAQYFTLNHAFSIEPRFSIKYQFKPNQSIAFGTGLHSQMLPVYQYFLQDDNARQYNKNLDFIRSFHLVAGYDVFFKQDIRIKAEAYFQVLWGIPVDTFASSYNMLNEGSGFDRFFPGKLTNAGLGRNMGVEFTLEKFFTHNWFFMFSASLYDSRLQGGDKKWYNSDFNGNYILNALGTKEFKWGKKRLNTIGIGGKITFGGGQRYTPYDTTLSQLREDPVVQNSQRNKLQFKPYFRFDLKLNYRCNTKRYTHEVGIDLVNIAQYKNILRVQYINPQEPAREIYQLGFLPLFYYRLDFWIGKKNW
jgi:hypothetical protein